MGLGAQGDLAAAGRVGRAHTGAPHDDAAGREVRALDVGHQLLQAGVGIIQQAADAVDDLAQVVRRDVGRHADRDAGRAVDQKVREAAGQNHRLLQAVVIVWPEINRLFIDVGEHPHRDFAHLGLGVSVSRRRVAVDRTEVAVAVHQRIAQ